MYESLKAIRDFLTGFMSQRRYWEFRASWRPMEAIIGRDDEQLHLASGLDCVELMDRLGVLEGCRTSLGIGTGGGRVEHWLGSRVQTCCGVDISLGMTRLAKANAPKTLFVVGSGSDLGCFRDGAIDLVYSFIVFQHMGNTKVQSYFRETARVLRSGGWFLFQIATDSEGWRRFVPFRERHPYAIRWRDVREVCGWLEATGLDVQRLVGSNGREVTRDEAATRRNESMILVARKP